MASYSLTQKLLHWLSAITVIGLFAVGWWMVELDYYNEWYQTAPHWHKSIGILLIMATVVRLIIKIKRPKVVPLASHASWEKLVAKITHNILYLGLFLLFVSGYLIATADGEAISVFDWFEVPALWEFDDNQDIAGAVHKWGAYSLIGLVLLHILGALKHHFIDKDETIRRMIGQTKGDE